MIGSVYNFLAKISFKSKRLFSDVTNTALLFDFKSSDQECATDCVREQRVKSCQSCEKHAQCENMSQQIEDKIGKMFLQPQRLLQPFDFDFLHMWKNVIIKLASLISTFISGLI